MNRLAGFLSDSTTSSFAWAFMIDHHRLLLKTGSAPIAMVMRRLLTGYEVSFNRRHRRRDHLFTNRQIKHIRKGNAMKTNPDLISPCGLYCGVCAVYLADRDNNIKLKERLLNLYQGGTPGKGLLPNSESLSIQNMRCRGCLSDDRFMHCQQCEIRACTQEKGYTGCHECDDFPCRHIDDFPMAVGKKVILRSVLYRREFGTAKWVMDEEARYVCPECGNKVFRGAMKCNQCKVNLNLD